MKDFLEQELSTNDAVVMVAGKYVELRRGIIVAFTAQKLRLLTPHRFTPDRSEELLIYPYQCVRLEDSQAEGAAWDRLRTAVRNR